MQLASIYVVVHFFQKIKLHSYVKKSKCSSLAHPMQCGFQSKSSAVFFFVFKNLRPTKKKPFSSLTHLMQCGFSFDALLFLVG